MRFISLFSGIGGLDLGLERSGMDLVAHSEVDPYACRVHAKHWPDVPNLGDVKLIDWSEVARQFGSVDLVCGGFPCQPVSQAGRRKGQEDKRWLWPEFARCLRHLRPRWAIVENVPGLRSKGFEEVAADLASLGYDFEWESLPAAAFGAPHLRYRVFIVAHRGGAGRREDAGGAHGDEAAHEGWPAQDHHVSSGDGEGGRAGTLADTHGGRLEERPECDSEPHQPGALGDDVDRRRDDVADAEVFLLGSRLCEGESSTLGGGRPGDSGGPHYSWPAEPDVGRVAYGVPSRVDRLRGLGNGVVPQVAEWVGRQILIADGG